MTRRSKVSLAVLGVLLGLYSLLRLGFLAGQRHLLRGRAARRGGLGLRARPALRRGRALHPQRPAAVHLQLRPPAGGRAPLQRHLLHALRADERARRDAQRGRLRLLPDDAAPLLYEPFDRPAEVASMVPQWFQEYPAVCIGVLVAGAAFVLGPARGRAPPERAHPGRGGLDALRLDQRGRAGGAGRPGRARRPPGGDPAPGRRLQALGARRGGLPDAQHDLHRAAQRRAQARRRRCARCRHAEAAGIVADMLADPDETPPRPGLALPTRAPRAGRAEEAQRRDLPDGVLDRRERRTARRKAGRRSRAPPTSTRCAAKA